MCVTLSLFPHHCHWHWHCQLPLTTYVSLFLVGPCQTRARRWKMRTGGVLLLQPSRGCFPYFQCPIWAGISKMFTAGRKCNNHFRHDVHVLLNTHASWTEIFNFVLGWEIWKYEILAMWKLKLPCLRYSRRVSINLCIKVLPMLKPSNVITS